MLRLRRGWPLAGGGEAVTVPPGNARWRRVRWVGPVGATLFANWGDDRFYIRPRTWNETRGVRVGPIVVAWSSL